MLTKEEYIDIIDFLDFFYGDNLVAIAELRKEKSKELQKEDVMNFKSKLDKLKQLIEEHFDNPPLTLDEIKVSQGVPIWDNKYKGWIVVVFKDFSFDELMVHSCGQKITWAFYFEENRFYRKQVNSDAE